MTRCAAPWLALAALLFFVGGASGQDPVPLRVGVAGGPSFPLDELNRTAATGFHVGGWLALSGRLVDVRAEGLFERFTRDDGGSLEGFGGIASAILPLGAARTTYLIGGLGALYVAPDGPYEPETELTFAVGAGVRLSLFSLEIRYLASGAQARSIPVSFGLRLR